MNGHLENFDKKIFDEFHNVIMARVAGEIDGEKQHGRL